MTSSQSHPKPNFPHTDAFWILASAYLDAGDAALATIRSDEYTGFLKDPCVFLYFRSIELSLKAALVSRGVSEKEITKKIGHKLSALLNRLNSFQDMPELGLTPEETDLIHSYSDNYSNKWYEYPDDLWACYPELEIIQHIAKVICAAVQKDNVKATL